MDMFYSSYPDSKVSEQNLSVVVVVFVNISNFFLQEQHGPSPTKFGIKNSIKTWIQVCLDGDRPFLLGEIVAK